MAIFRYLCFKFHQRQGSGGLLSFHAPVGEIKTWAGVPRKHFNYLHGFQRALTDKRVQDLKEFFDEDTKNTAPTSVVIAIRKGAFQLTARTGAGNADGSDGLSLYELTFALEPLENSPTTELVDSAIDLLRQRLPYEVTQLVEEDLEAALEVNAEAEADEEAEAEAEGDEHVGLADDFDTPPQSHLVNFFSELLGIRSGLSQITDEEKLREVLFSLLKPAIIVDGQHRVYGAAALDESMQFAVTAIPDADWLEQVFQFVVINQKAKPIPPAFLHAIIATSLTDEEIQALYTRLRKSGVDVDRAQIMNRINSEADSPFQNMIDFEISGASGFLKFPGMSALMKAFLRIPNTHSALVASHSNWGTHDTWLRQFYAFWRGIRDYFREQDPRLWQQPSESNPNNLLKIVSLQEVQKIVLDAWADSRMLKLEDPSNTYKAAKTFWEGFPSTFFSDEWKKKGLQTAVGRKYLAEAIQTTRRKIGQKNWGHRRLGLFQDG